MVASSASSGGGSAKGIVITLVVVLVLGGLAYYFVSARSSQPYSAPTANEPTMQTPGTSTPEPVTAPPPTEVYSYVGEVRSVGNGQLLILAKKDQNLVEADTAITVKVDANTQVIRRTIPRTLPEDGTAPVFKQENIALSDIQAGEQVTVVSATNILGLTEFTASRIEVLNVQ